MDVNIGSAKVYVCTTNILIGGTVVPPALKGLTSTPLVYIRTAIIHIV